MCDKTIAKTDKLNTMRAVFSFICCNRVLCANKTFKTKQKNVIRSTMSPI